MTISDEERDRSEAILFEGMEEKIAIVSFPLKHRPEKVQRAWIGLIRMRYARKDRLTPGEGGDYVFYLLEDKIEEARAATHRVAMRRQNDG